MLITELMSESKLNLTLYIKVNVKMKIKAEASHFCCLYHCLKDCPPDNCFKTPNNGSNHDQKHKNSKCGRYK